jgi:hypothetical protein
LGRIIALQAFQADDIHTHNEDIELGLSCLRIANRRIPKDNEHKQFHRLEAELLMRRGDLGQAEELIRSNEFLMNYYHGYLLSDLDNPAVSGDESTYETWLEGFNKPFTENGLAPIKPQGHSWKFNDLETAYRDSIYDDPKVTVVMTSYKPEPETFLVAVRSILNQTWENIELIIVDDASPSEYASTLEHVRGLDPRIKLIKLEQNGGTYRARNVGFKAAEGLYITGQDSDDWSHPERIERQVAYLTSEPAATGVVVEAVRVDEQLVRTSPGRLPERPCEVSLMIRRALADEVGGYIDARKGADSEFRLRLEYYNGRKTHAIRKPLYLTRIGHDSLSREDFKPGWSHPVRRAFWNACRYWHRNTPAAGLRLEAAGTEPVPVPNKFKIHPPVAPSQFDVVFVADWRAYTGQQRLLIDSIEAHYHRGKRVGMMHLETLISPSKETTRLSPEIQALVNNGVVAELIPDEDAHAHAVVISDASILQFAPVTGVNITSNVTLITPDFPPYVGNNGTVIYRPEDCSLAAEQIFGGEVIWTSTDPRIHDCLAELSDNIFLHPDLLPTPFDCKKWQNNRPRLMGDAPIVGRHSENYEEMWPKNLRISKHLWPHDPEVDVRILGDAKPYLRKYQKRDYPQNWLVFRDRDISPEAFMTGIDFFIYHPDEHFEQGFSREALEATAAGVLAILPDTFKRAHGESALYASPEHIQDIVAELSNNRQEYVGKVSTCQTELATVIDNRSHVEYVERLQETTASKSVGVKK